MTNEEVAQKLKEKQKTGEVAKHALGLMNKEVKIVKDEDDEGAGADPSSFNPDDILTNQQVVELPDELISSPPSESYLMSKSMWPEKNKWYGHAYEIFTLATS